MEAKLVIQAEPEPIEVYQQRTAVIVVDMQNAFVSRGGTLDLCGMDTSVAQEIIGPCKNVISAAREAGCKIIYLRHGYSPDLCDAGGENSPNWHKELALVLMRKQPKLKGKLLIRGSWDAEIVEDLKPKESDIVVWKQRYSGFVGTNLNIILKTHDIKYLAFVGVATNVCVEASIRDAYYLDYFPILVSDAAANAGPPLTQEATVFNVMHFYGWVTTTRNIIKALRQK